MYIRAFGQKCQYNLSYISARPGAMPSAMCLELHSATPLATPSDFIPFNCNIRNMLSTLDAVSSSHTDTIPFISGISKQLTHVHSTKLKTLLNKVHIMPVYPGYPIMMKYLPQKLTELFCIIHEVSAPRL